MLRQYRVRTARNRLPRWSAFIIAAFVAAVAAALAVK